MSRIFLAVFLSIFLVLTACKKDGQESSKSSSETTESQTTVSSTSAESESETDPSITPSETDSSSAPSETSTGIDLPTEEAQLFASICDELTISLEWTQDDDGTTGEIDPALSPDMEGLYIHFKTKDLAQKQFANVLENGEIFGDVKKQYIHTDDEPKMIIYWGDFKGVNDLMVITQYDTEYIYLYGRGDDSVQKVQKICEKLNIDLSH